MKLKLRCVNLGPFESFTQQESEDQATPDQNRTAVLHFHLQDKGITAGDPDLQDPLLFNAV